MEYKVSHIKCKERYWTRFLIITYLMIWDQAPKVENLLAEGITDSILFGGDHVVNISVSLVTNVLVKLRKPSLLQSFLAQDE